ncbi:MAG: hypothetical protein AB7T86_16025 [Xanthobacteraceae bacterium]|uniref:hypothetical protein n=1 Tax=Pseudolabrys sp. TaxID=1960880 RepID=UPI003D0B61D1
MRHALTIGTTLSLIAVTMAHAQPAGIAEILPIKAGQAICFTADLKKPVTMDIEDWSQNKISMEPVPGEKQKDGKPLMRPVPALLKGRQVTTLVMQVTAADLNPSEPYDFILRATVKGWKKPLYAAGSCAPTKDEAGKSDANKLSCIVECDGGSIGLARTAGTSSADAIFGRDGGLRMTAGCGDEESGPSYRLKAAAAEQLFRLAPVAAKQCVPLRRWIEQ